MTDIEEKLIFLLQHVKRGTGMIRTCYELISTAPEEDRAHLLERMMRGAKEICSDEKIAMPEYMTGAESIRSKIRYTEDIETFMTQLRRENPKERAFYARAWEYISKVLPDRRAAVTALEYCMDSVFFPYFQINEKEPDVQMDKAAYDGCLSDIGRDKLARLKYQLAIETDPMKRAMYIERGLSALKCEEDRLVFLTEIISSPCLRMTFADVMKTEAEPEPELCR